MEQLPLDFKNRFPSSPDTYSKLSDAIHLANDDASLFQQVRADIEKHFEYRRLLELGDTL